MKQSIPSAAAEELLAWEHYPRLVVTKHPPNPGHHEPTGHRLRHETAKAQRKKVSPACPDPSQGGSDGAPETSSV